MYTEQFMAYDIETTSINEDGRDEVAFPYSFAFQVSDHEKDLELAKFRRWSDVKPWLDGKLTELGCRPAHGDDSGLYLVIYVHNLSYEYKYMQHSFEWEDVFAISSEHRIARARTTSGIEFRCSYFLTNTGLAKVGKDVGIAKGEDFDYNLVRHHHTMFSDEEELYVDNDVKIITELIRQRLEREKSDDGRVVQRYSALMSSIPMTKTGYTRRTVRKACARDVDYMRDVKRLRMTVDDYLAARQAFGGGFTHANAVYTDRTVDGVVGYDIASSYPASILQGVYPMESFQKLETPSYKAFSEMLG